MIYASPILLQFKVAQYLSKTYGDKAPRVADLAAFTGRRWPLKGKRIVEEFPYIEANVLYAIKEYACTVVDVIARRTSLAFLNVQAAEEAIPQIIDIMGKELGWSKEEKQVILCVAFLLIKCFFVRNKTQKQDISCRLWDFWLVMKFAMSRSS